jgi:hypothetical protein
VGAASGTAVEALAGANATDDVSGVESVKFNTGRTVTVKTISKTPDGRDKVPFTFARVFGLDGQTVRAEAEAAWGPPARLRTWPMAVGGCELRAAALHIPITIYFHDPQSLPDPLCPNGPSGADLPGGFGWLQSDETSCGIKLQLGNDANADPGNDVSSACEGSLHVGDVVALPVFDQATGTGSNGRYHVIDFAALRVQGFRLGPASHGWVQNPPCSQPQTCLRGEFIRRVFDGGDISSAPSYGGITVVKLLR